MTDTPERQQVDAIALLTFDAAARLNAEQLATTIGAELERIVNPFVHHPEVKGRLREVELAGFRIVNLQQEGAIYGNAPRQSHPDRITDALLRAEAFMSGFEDDELQEGIADDLAVIRAALIERENRSLTPAELEAIGLPYRDANGELQQ